LDECPLPTPIEGGIGKEGEKDIGVEALLDACVALKDIGQGGNRVSPFQPRKEEEPEVPSHRPQNGQSRNPSKQAEISSSFGLQNAHNVGWKADEIVP
jgi:hypothetical protein